MNHLLVIYAFLIPISSRAKSSIFVAIVIFFLLRRNYIYYLRESLSNKIVQAFLIFFLIHIVWLIGSDNLNRGLSLISEMKYLLFPLIFFSFVDKQFSMKIIYAFVFGMLYSEILSYLIFFDFLPHKLVIFDLKFYEIQALNNPTPFLDHSRYNVLISMAIGILLFNFFKDKELNFLKIVSFIFIITASINMTLIGGRIGYFTFIFVILFVVFLRFKKSFIRISFLVILLIFSFFIFSYNYSEIFQQRMNETVTSIKKLNEQEQRFNSSMGLRIGFWIYSLEVVKDNLLFGVGTGDGTVAVREYIDSKDEYLKKISHPHNEYLKNLLQFGLIGFLFFLNIFYQIFRTLAIDDELKKISLITTLAISLGILTSIMGSGIYLPLWVTILAASFSRNEYLSEKYIFNIKTFFGYSSIIIFVLVLALLQ
jgi:O-antigen ligase